MTDSEQRYFLIRGLTADYNSVRASILSYRDRYDRPADLVTAISLLEDYEDNVLSTTTVTRTVSNNREVTLTTVASGSATPQPRGKDNGVVIISRRGDIAAEEVPANFGMSRAEGQS